MKPKMLFIVSLIIMIITLVCMGINRFVMILPDIIIRITGIIMLINISVFSYSIVKLKKIND
ncbi:MAG: hypothetical protein Q8900_09380 [Bacillota bacterium]|nr:hypothetical protein [Bacillota bacterium]